jgi:outer membrane protein assembly factor BamB
LLQVDRRGQRSIAVYERSARGAPQQRLRITASGALGTPALLHGALLVPWGEGYVSALDVNAQTELGRARLGSEPLHALWWGGALFFGGPPWVELTPGGTPPYALPRRPLPGAVLGPLPDAGTDVTRLYVQPAPNTTHGGAGGAHYMATYGRIAFGLEREQGALAWVLALPGRALAALASEGRFIVCDDTGGVRALSSATGRVERLWQIVRQRSISPGEPALAACALAPGATLAAEPEVAASAPEPLLEQLAKVLALSDPELTDAQRFLSRELAARPEPEATRLLIELVRRHSLSRVLQSEAEDLLATRRNGADHMLAALSESGPQGEEALPPIAPLGEALAALDEKRAAPLLARQLNRPAHTASAVARAAAALERLASEDEYGELSVFFSLHRTSADSPEWVAAVVSVGRTLLRVGGERARTLIRFALRDPLTHAEIKAALERELGTGTSSPLTRKEFRRP